MTKEKALDSYFKELGRRSREAKIKKFGAEGFKEFMKHIGKKGGRTRWDKEKNKKQ